MEGQFLTADELVTRWKGSVTRQTLANWRARKRDGKPAPRGPAFTKIGSRVLYPLDQVEAWEAVNLHAVNDNSPG